MAIDSYEHNEIKYCLRLSERLRSAMNQRSQSEEYRPYAGKRYYVTLNNKEQLLDINLSSSRFWTEDIVSFPVSDLDDLRSIVYQILKLGFRCLHWTSTEYAEEHYPLPPAGLERLNYYLAYMQHWNEQCETCKYILTEISSLGDRGVISPDTCTVQLLNLIPTHSKGSR
ncbi:hypothetical protein [Photobacterium lutimaris]|uniref:Uncharacterized protein n=1 Tax=Photobacterium lutimaris TaxID=388278 RepID=A0A2T3ITQ3_9GAMM|nr:hypothetical protein [Photobacterium lutimaris]PSU31745.1 hypothetical protein C9I99_21405 [Photobacterium lutimaris]TDR72610.1 hypothetical protein DFP78_11386 [Photobacterium lutimaris]